MKRTLSVLPLLLGWCSADCPPAVLIEPCTCEDELFPLVVCTYISDVETLRDVFARSADRTFSVFALNDSSVQYLPAEAITDKGFVNLILKNVTMAALFDAPPGPHNQVNTILMQDVKFQRGVGWNLFGPMGHLKYLSVENTEVRSLGKSFTDNIGTGMTNLILKDAKTRKIQYNAFSKLSNLFDLEIVDGELRSLQRTMFAKPSALEEIDFSGNKIRDLPEDLFSDMPVLRQVNLSRNQISVFSRALFGAVVERRGTIDLNGNPLKCDCSVLWFVSDRKGYISGRCASPLDKEGKLLQDLRRGDLDYCV